MAVGVGSGRVVAIGDCRLVRGEHDWPYPALHCDAIEAHWQRRTAECPGFFNGTVHLLSHYRIADGILGGQIFPVPFKTFLYWREGGATDTAVHDAFGSALIRSREGHVLLGRQRPGNVNSGLAYTPGGFIDRRDIGPDGTVDIRASILREVHEETGLGAEHWTIAPGYRVTFHGQHISIAMEMRSALAAEDLAARVRARLVADPSSELEDIVVVKGTEGAARHPMPGFVETLLSDVFAAGP